MRVARKFLILFAVVSGQLALAGPQSSTTVEADASSTWASYSRKTVLKAHPLATVGGMILSAMTSSTVMVFPVEMEFAMAPNVSLYGIVAPTVVSSGSTTVYGAALSAGLRMYATGHAPDGFWIGGHVGTLWLTGNFASGVSVDLQPQAGWQWVSDNGFTIGVGAGISLVSLASMQPAYTLVIPIGFAW